MSIPLMEGRIRNLNIRQRTSIFNLYNRVRFTPFLWIIIFTHLQKQSRASVTYQRYATVKLTQRRIYTHIRKFLRTRPRNSVIRRILNIHRRPFTPSRIKPSATEKPNHRSVIHKFVIIIAKSTRGIRIFIPISGIPHMRMPIKTFAIIG